MWFNIKNNLFFRVPVCYRAVDNPLFDQLAEQVTSQGEQFNPAYIAPIVNKVTSFMGSPITRPGKLKHFPPEKFIRTKMQKTLSNSIFQFWNRPCSVPQAIKPIKHINSSKISQPSSPNMVTLLPGWCLSINISMIWSTFLPHNAVGSVWTLKSALCKAAAGDQAPTNA